MTVDELTVIAADVVATTQRKLPRELRSLATAVPVHYHALPGEDVLADGFPDDILGLFSGPSHGSETEPTHPTPPQIVLYLENLWDFAEGDGGVFREETRVTYLHELGHYFGWDEEDLAARGLG
ncbi:MAG: metallopeptidase family protein [Opitutus sp.]